MVKKKIVTFMVVATMLSSVNVYAGENKDVDINLQNNSLESVQRDYGIKNQEDYQKIARFAIVSELSDIEISDIENLDMIELSNIIPLYNNEDMLAYSGMNFKI